MKTEKDPSGHRPFSYDAAFWSHFGQGEDWSYGRCNRCLEHVYSTRTPNEDTIDCWKILIFEAAVTDFGQVQNHLVERSALGIRFKCSSFSPQVLQDGIRVEEETLHSSQSPHPLLASSFIS